MKLRDCTKQCRRRPQTFVEPSGINQTKRGARRRAFGALARQAISSIEAVRHDGDFLSPLVRILPHDELRRFIRHEHDGVRFLNDCGFHFRRRRPPRSGSSPVRAVDPRIAEVRDPRKSCVAMHAQADEMIRPRLRERDEAVEAHCGRQPVRGFGRGMNPDPLRIRTIAQRRKETPHRPHDRPFLRRTHSPGLDSWRRRHINAVAPVRTAAPRVETDDRRLPAERHERAEGSRHLRRARAVHRRHLPRHGQQALHSFTSA